jgi:ABC-2 type transport system ATP-binding protein
MEKIMIEINGITKVYSKKVKAVDQLSLTIPDGKIVGFIGPNGAGKTTTLKMMCGILKPDEGSVLLNGFDITKQPLLAKKQFGFVADNADIFLRLKGIEYLNLMADIYEVDTALRSERIQEYARQFEMTQALNDKILSYSHGMRQKIVIMGAILHQPSIWILDEPLTGLDPQSSFELKQMMRKHASDDKTVFFSTHVLEVAEKLCDYVIIINFGKILYEGTLEQLKSQYEQKNLEEIFLEVTKRA